MKQDLDEDIFDLESMPLDRAWNDQPRLYWTYSSKLVEARDKLKRAERNYEVVKADTDKDIRLHPNKYKIAKITEDVVKQTIVRSGACKLAYEEVIVAEYEVNILLSFVKSLEQRKSALEARVQLEVHGLYAECKPPKGEEAREHVDGMRKKEIRKRCQIK